MFKRTELQKNNIVDDKSNTVGGLFVCLFLCSNLSLFLRTFLCAGLGPSDEDSGANSEGSLLLGIPGAEYGHV